MTVPTSLPPDHGPESFYEGPGQAVVAEVIVHLKAIPQIDAVFGEDIFDEARHDLSATMLPAMLVFPTDEVKQGRLLTGTVEIWVIASVRDRRAYAMRFIRAAVSALYEIFDTAEALLDAIPASWEIGQRIQTDFAKAYANAELDGVAPMAVLKVSYSIDLEEWARYLCGLGRERDPLAESLVNLESIHAQIQAYSTVEDVVDDPDLSNPDYSVGIERSAQ